MSWNLSFISEQEFTEHVRATIQKYGDKLESFDLRRFNRNIVDPVKLIFDKTVYRATWEETISNEIFRQRDKSNNNDIGYFHQRIFQYVPNCHVPPNGEEGGWDVIYTNPDGIALPDGSVVHTVYVEMKNKHNTMNSSASGKTFIKMQNQLLKDDDCACFLVEAIAKKSQNIKWETSVDGQRMGHRLIRRVSLDQFYALVTGQEDAFYQMCMTLPEVIQSVVEAGGNELVPQALALLHAEGRLQGGEVKWHGIGHPPAPVVGDVGDDPVAIVPPLGKAGQPVEHPLVVGVEDVGAILVDQDARLVGPVIGVARHVVPPLQHQHPAALLRQRPGRDRSGIARAHHQRVKCLFQSCLPPFRAGAELPAVICFDMLRYLSGA